MERFCRRLAAPALIAAALAGAIAGCGSSHPSGSGVDPATMTPASALLYLGATVRAEGSLKADALAAGRRLTRQADPYLRLVQLLQTPGSGTLSFGHDVAPWLGGRAGIFFTLPPSSGTLQALLQRGLLGGSTNGGAWPFSEPGQEGALVLDTSDLAKARSFLNAQAQRAGAHATSYSGVAYQASADGRAAFALVDRLAVLGSEAGVHGVIETAQGGPALARSPGYAKLLAAAPAGALAHLYANPAPPAASGASAEAKSPSGSSLLALLAGARPLDVSLVPAAGSLALDADALAASTSAPGRPAAQAGGLLAASAEGAQALSELPGESWLAAGLGNVGGALGSGLEGLRGLLSLTTALAGSGAPAPSAGATLSVKGLIEGLLTPLDALTANSAQARADFLSWMGSAGLFASGSSLLELKAAVVIASKDPARSRAAVAKLAALLRKAGGEAQPVSIPGTEAAVTAKLTGLPVTLAIADGPGANGQAEFVLGIGEASVQDALKPASTLASAPSLGAAASMLGEGIQPSLIVSFPTFLTLLEGVGLGEDPTIGPAVPYLRSLNTLAGGGRSLGNGIERLRLAFGLQPAG
jgi:hypothetical protein